MKLRECLVLCFLYAVVHGDAIHAQTADADALKLAAQLRQRSDTDQAVRRALPACGTNEAERHRLIEAIQTVDGGNLAWIKEVVATHGWPGKSLVGIDGAQCAWLLVQHADADRDFQELCLRKMEAMPSGEVTSSQIAFLTDRLLVARGKKQKFGTQAALEGDTLKPFPIEDEPNIDHRRREVGLEPLADYLKSMERLYAPLRAAHDSQPDHPEH